MSEIWQKNQTQGPSRNVTRGTMKSDIAADVLYGRIEVKKSALFGSPSLKCLVGASVFGYEPTQFSHAVKDVGVLDGGLGRTKARMTPEQRTGLVGGRVLCVPTLYPCSFRLHSAHAPPRDPPQFPPTIWQPISEALLIIRSVGLSRVARGALFLHNSVTIGFNPQISHRKMVLQLCAGSFDARGEFEAILPRVHFA
ncbi:hypothetical protein R6Q59_010056 [Mikania micrantha]